MTQGRVFAYGDNVDTDVIIPARYLNVSDPAELAAHAMEDIDPDFSHSVKKGDIIVAGENFGCGSSREHAPIALKQCGVACVIAVSFARIFYRNAINIGLPVMECPDAPKLLNGTVAGAEPETGRILDLSSGKEYRAEPLPPFIMEIVRAGGLMNSIKKS